MSQTTRSAKKSSHGLSAAEQEVKDALLDHSAGSGAWIFDEIDSAEDRATQP